MTQRKRILLLAGETWFPSNGRIAPRRILVSLSNRITYRSKFSENAESPPASCSPASMRKWIVRWDCKI